MQQTDKYKLNLIEKDDVFSPDALNENMEKVEGAIAAGDAALDQRVVALEARKMAVGWYILETDKTVTVDLGFTPKAVVIVSVSYYGGGTSILIVTDSPASYRFGGEVQIQPNGFSVNPFTNGNGKYNYVAFA